MYHTVINNKKINMGYIPRFDAAKASQIMSDVNKMILNDLDDQYLFVTSEPYLNRLIVPWASGKAHCFSIDKYLIFFKKSERTQALAAYLQKNVDHEPGPEILLKSNQCPGSQTGPFRLPRQSWVPMKLIILMNTFI
jgi:hypothetical protein